MPIVMPVMVSVVRSFLRPRFLRSLMRSSPFRRHAINRVAISHSGTGVVNGDPAHGRAIRAITEIRSDFAATEPMDVCPSIPLTLALVCD